MSEEKQEKVPSIFVTVTGEGGEEIYDKETNYVVIVPIKDRGEGNLSVGLAYHLPDADRGLIHAAMKICSALSKSSSPVFKYAGATARQALVQVLSLGGHEEEEPVH